MKIKKVKKKPYIIFSTPRSGSNPVCEVFGNYLQVLNGQANYGEIFNLEIIRSQMQLNTGNPAQNRIDAFEVLKQRLAEIEKDPDHFFFKVFPNQINELMLFYLQSKYELIFLERRNVWEQLLSFLISSETQKWYEEAGIQVNENELIAKRGHFNSFFRLKKEYQKIRDCYKNPKVIIFEDFLSDGISKVISSIGLEPIDEGLFQATPVEYRKQNNYDKETRFANIEEVRNWYQAQSLNNREIKKSTK